MEIYRSLVGHLRNQHEAIANMIEGLEDTRVMGHPETGKWTIHDNITHLA